MDIDLTKGQTQALRIIKAAHGNSIEGLSVAPDGKGFVTGSHDKTAKVWDAAAGKAVATLTGHEDGIWTVDHAPDGGRVVTGGPDSTLRVWDLKKGAVIMKMKAHHGTVYSAKYAPDGLHFASGGSGAEISLWDVRSDAKPVKELKAPDEIVEHLCWHPNGQHLFATTHHGDLLEIDAATWTISGSAATNPDRKIAESVTCSLSVPDAVVCGNEQGHVSVHRSDPKLGRVSLASSFLSHLDSVRYVELSRGLPLLLSTGRDGSVRVWGYKNPQHPELLTNLVGHSESVNCGGFLAGETVVTGSWDQSICIWKLPV